MTAYASRIILFTAVATGLTFCGSSNADETLNGSAAIQSQLDQLNKKLMSAKKQSALKKASIDIAKQRAAELEKLLKESQQRIAEESKAYKAAEAQGLQITKQITAVSTELKQHQHAESLLATAADAKRRLNKATQEYNELNSLLAASQKNLVQQQQAHKTATTALKTAQENLPKKLEELKKARVIYDELGKAVDIAQQVVSDSRKAAKAANESRRTETARVRKAEAALTAATENVQMLEASLATIQEAAKSVDADAEAAGVELKVSVQQAKATEAKATELVAAAKTLLDAANTKASTANDALQAANSQLREAQNEYASQSRIHFKIQLSVSDLQNAERSNQHHIKEALTQQEQLTATQKELTAKIVATAGTLEKLQSDFVSQQKRAEAELESLGRFVSFSRHIAPIFAKRCVACHNTRTASGRLNMDSFAALLKGGESGAAIEAHDAENSLLWTMIENHSMPKEAEPLADEEVALIKQWINLGAPLDAGIPATAELFQVIPEIAQPLPPETYRVAIPVTATAFNADASILASSGYHEILLWNTADGSLLRRITNVAERVYDLEFNADGSILAVAAGTPGQLGEVKLFETATGTHQKTLVRTKDAVFAVAFRPDGKQIAAGGADRIVYTADVTTGELVLQIEDHADWVMDVNWSPDGTQLVTASRDKTTKVFDVTTGRSSITFNGHGDAVYSAAFLVDGKAIVSAGSDRKVRVWNSADAKEVRKIDGFGSDIFRVSVSADNHLFTACADRNAREHDLGNGKIVRTFEGHKDWVYTLCYNEDKQLIATGSYDGEVRIWNSTDGSVKTSFIAIPKANNNATVAVAEE